MSTGLGAGSQTQTDDSAIAVSRGIELNAGHGIPGSHRHRGETSDHPHTPSHGQEARSHLGAWHSADTPPSRPPHRRTSAMALPGPGWWVALPARGREPRPPPQYLSGWSLLAFGPRTA